MGIADALRALSDHELAELLARRPELADPPPATFTDLASRASAPYSLQACLAQLRAPVREVVDGLAYLGEPSTVRDLADLAGTPTDPALLAAALDDARRLGLVIATRIHEAAAPTYALVPALRRMVPSPFGLRHPLAVVLDRYTMSDLRAIAHNLAIGEQNEPKALTVARIVDHLTLASNVLALVERAPHDAERFLLGIHELGGVTGIDTRPFSREQLPDGLRWLYGHALLVPLDWETSIVPREVALALRGGTPLRAYQLQPPAVPEPTGRRAGRLPTLVELPPPALVDAIASIGLWLGREPLTSLRDGGVAVRDVRTTAKRLGVDDATAARLLDLAGHASLITHDGFRSLIVATPVFDEWLATPSLDRWRTLVDTWTTLGSPLTRPSLPGVRTAPVSFTHYNDDNQIWRRGFVLRALHDAPGHDVASLTASARWYAPGRWTDAGDPAEMVTEILQETSLLGLVRDGALAPLASAVLFGDDDAIDEAAAAVFPAAVSSFTVQADLTALAPQELDPVVAGTLARCAEVESRGAATVYRFSETSLRRAFDLGEDAESVQAFLEAHAHPAVPQALRYLVDDVARRYGGVRVGSAVSYVRTNDEALLAELLRAKKVAKLKLRQLAPTVAVSSLPPTKLLQGLRDAGFLPVAEDADGAVVTSAAPEPVAEIMYRRRARPRNEAIWRAVVDADESTGDDSLDSYEPRVRSAIAKLRASEPPR